MKYLIPLAFILLLSFSLSGQVTVTTDATPSPDDTLRQSVTLMIEGFDYQSAGENHTWDFSGLTVVFQQVDTFVSVSSTPSLYQAVFNNTFIFPDYKATVANKLIEFGLIPNLSITDAYQFFRLDGNEFREVGVGITLEGVPLPLMYQDIDTLYRFPLEYGDVDSATATISIDIPGLGFLGVDRKRKNIADGWGTVITPYGQFEALRVMTEITEYDTVYIDSLNMGFPINRSYTEYKWMTDEFPLPLLTITAEDLVVTASYLDSLRTDFLGTDEEAHPALDFDFKAYPNPASDYLTISYELVRPSFVVISFYSLYGKEIQRVLSCSQDRGLYSKMVNIPETDLGPGVYLLLLQIDGQVRVKRVLVQ